MVSNTGSRLRALARRGATLLADDATDRIASFVHARHNRDGGFADRDGASDLYYTLFGLDCLDALGHEPLQTRTRAFLEEHAGRADLDLVHLSCLIRSLARLGELGPWSEDLLSRLDRFRDPLGGWRLELDAPHRSVYAAFLAALCHAECGRETDTDPTPGLEKLRSADGGFADRPAVQHGTTTVTAAAAVLLADRDSSAAGELSAWLLDRQSPDGGYLASAHTPLPDLLSTASALFALDVLGQGLNGETDATLGFVAGQWLECGGFSGHALDDIADCEYTYYGLLSLGALAQQGSGAVA